MIKILNRHSQICIELFVNLIKGLKERQILMQLFLNYYKHNHNIIKSIHKSNQHLSNNSIVNKDINKLIPYKLLYYRSNNYISRQNFSKHIKNNFNQIRHLYKNDQLFCTFLSMLKKSLINNKDINISRINYIINKHIKTSNKTIQYWSLKTFGKDVTKGWTPKWYWNIL